MTLRPYMSDELLPTTFRNLVVNDLLDQISFPITQFMNDPQNAAYLDQRAAPAVANLFKLIDQDVTSKSFLASLVDIPASQPKLHGAPDQSDDDNQPSPHHPPEGLSTNSKISRLKALRWNLTLQALFMRPEWAWVDDVLKVVETQEKTIPRLHRKQNDAVQRLERAQSDAKSTEPLLKLEPRLKASFETAKQASSPSPLLKAARSDDLDDAVEQINDAIKALESTPQTISADLKDRIKQILAELKARRERIAKLKLTPAGLQDVPIKVVDLTDDWAALESVTKIAIDAENRRQLAAKQVETTSQAVQKAVDLLKPQAFALVSSFSLVPQTKSRRSRMPFPPSQMVEVYGQEAFYRLAEDAYLALSKERFSRPSTEQTQIYVHLPDVQGYLQEELAAAQKMLQEPANYALWNYCTPDLAGAVRDHKTAYIGNQRQEFLRAIFGRTSPSVDEPLNENPFSRTTATLAWAIIVESALLTEQLKQDIKESAGLKGSAVIEPMPYDFFHPNPSQGARMTFNQYVQCCWPIHVFALDPAAQQQNLASTFSTRREMQLAMSLAFINGQISAQNMMRYARRLEFDYATIDLNGTAIGFSHGEDTFGWRFYPRFQTPDVESNATVFFRDLLVGGPNKNQLLKQRRLEPGVRECYAVVIMPSFVPYAVLNVSSNWFSLIDPSKKQLNSTNAMQLSNCAKTISNCSQYIADGHCYRDGDLQGLFEKARQLETRFPLKSTMVQIPYENTLGGFGLFNAGVTDLAPELIGWYGTSSINPSQATTVFLVGNHFSVHQTTVIAGGQPISNYQLLSRQVMQVTIPQNPILVGDASQKFVDVHAATPYGVTQHLLIPAVTPPKPDDASGAAAATQSIAWKPAAFSIAFNYSGSGIAPPSAASAASGTTPPAPNYKPSIVLIQKGDIDPSKYDVVDVSLKFGNSIPSGPTNPIVLTGVPYDSKQQGYVVPLDQLTSQMFLAFGRVFGPEESNPPAPVTTTTQLTFRSSTAAYPDVLNKSTSNSLTINWIKAAQGSSSPGKAGP